MKQVSNPLVTERRLSRRLALKEPASFVLHLQKYNGRPEQRHPCLILDRSQNGFRLHGPVRLRPGQVVEVILGDDTVKCVVVWVGKAGEKNQGDAGLNRRKSHAESI